MLHRFQEQTKRTKSEVWGGKGTIQLQDLFVEAELGGRLSSISTITLMPGDSIGEHAHTENAEIYYILEGRGILIEDGAAHRVHAGDAQFCADGHTHGITNDTALPLIFLAVIMYNS